MSSPAKRARVAQLPPIFKLSSLSIGKVLDYCGRKATLTLYGDSRLRAKVIASIFEQITSKESEYQKYISTIYSLSIRRRDVFPAPATLAELGAIRRTLFLRHAEAFVSLPTEALASPVDVSFIIEKGYIDYALFLVFQAKISFQSVLNGCTELGQIRNLLLTVNAAPVQFRKNKLMLDHVISTSFPGLRVWFDLNIYEGIKPLDRNGFYVEARDILLNSFNRLSLGTPQKVVEDNLRITLIELLLKYPQTCNAGNCFNLFALILAWTTPETTQGKELVAHFFGERYKSEPTASYIEAFRLELPVNQQLVHYAVELYIEKFKGDQESIEELFSIEGVHFDPLRNHAITYIACHLDQPVKRIFFDLYIDQAWLSGYHLTVAGTINPLLEQGLIEIETDYFSALCENVCYDSDHDEEWHEKYLFFASLISDPNSKQYVLKEGIDATFSQDYNPYKERMDVARQLVIGIDAPNKDVFIINLLRRNLRRNAYKPEDCEQLISLITSASSREKFRRVYTQAYYSALFPNHTG